MVVFPLAALFSAAKAMAETFRALYIEKTTANRLESIVGFHEFEEIVRAPDWHALEQRFKVT